jgi:hypothetical protein
MKYILLQCGLANRLRTIIGFLYIAEKKNDKIIFHWDINDYACNGKFYELFNKINSNNVELIECKKENIDYFFQGQDTMNAIIKKYGKDLIPSNVNIEWFSNIEIEYYKKLIIKDNILKEVDNYCNKIGKFNAIHIRRTDHSNLARNNNIYTTFEEFDKFINEHNDLPIYLATDERKVQFKYPNTIKYKIISELNSTSLRQTSLIDAFIEILICAHAIKFKGSGYSSFSKLINIYNKIIYS